MTFTFKEKKVVAKLYNEDGSFKMAINIPSVYWPLNSDKYETFSYDECSEVEDPVVLEAFDATPYKIGRCYTNSELLAENLRQRGVEAKIYVGWMFVEEDATPIHHCWVVVNGSVLDLSDDMAIVRFNADNFAKANGKEECRAAMASFKKWAMQFPNSKRCIPVGKPVQGVLYVGCPCDPNEGRRIYNRLMVAYPNHECERNCDANHMSPTQKVLAEHGLMD